MQLNKVYGILLCGVLACGGCSHKQTKSDAESGPGNVDMSDVMGSSDAGNAMGLKTIHFDYDSSLLGTSAKDKIKEDASILKAHPSLKIQIEGHCDQHGGIQYNIALGERRAKSARDFLMDQGIAGDRITIISYGKEKLLDTQNTEAADKKNRRDNFVVTKQ